MRHRSNRDWQSHFVIRNGFADVRSAPGALLGGLAHLDAAPLPGNALSGRY